MISRMLADNVDDRNLRSARVVQISETVCETGTKMKQSACRFAGHACITIRRSSNDPFEETKHATHFRRSVKGSNYMDFRRARVREAGFNPSDNQRANQTFRPVHLCLPRHLSMS